MALPLRPGSRRLSAAAPSRWWGGPSRTRPDEGAPMSKLFTPRLFTSFAALALTIPLSLPAAAALDTFLKVPGAPGESTDKDHRGEIEILPRSWGATHP